MFAIEDIDPKIGRIEAELFTWEKETSDSVGTPVDLVNCAELLAGGKYEGSTNNAALDLENAFRGRKDAGLLCPIGLESMPVAGNFGSEAFQYMKIAVKGCDLDVCVSEDTINDTELNLVMLQAEPNIFADEHDSVIDYIQDLSFFYILNSN